MTILEKVQATFTGFKKGDELSRVEIIRQVQAKYGVNKGSIIPSDYCYNLVNLDKLSNPSLLEFNLFEYIESSRYVYIGRNQKYTGPIHHKIGLKYEEIGHWINGVRTLDYAVGNKGSETAQAREKCFSRFTIADTEKRLLIPQRVPLEVVSKTYMGNSQVSKLWNTGSKKDCENALDDYWGAVGPDNLRLELAFEDLDADRIRKMNVNQFYDFLHDEYFVWKYTAKNRLATTRIAVEKYQNTNAMGALESIHKQLFCFDREDIRTGLRIAKKIHGLGTAGASGLLAVLFPHEFGTVDQFVVKALCEVEGLQEHVKLERMSPESIADKDGVLMISIMRKKALELNKSFRTNVWTPRMIDKVLWAVGRV